MSTYVCPQRGVRLQSLNEGVEVWLKDGVNSVSPETSQTSSSVLEMFSALAWVRAYRRKHVAGQVTELSGYSVSLGPDEERERRTWGGLLTSAVDLDPLVKVVSPAFSAIQLLYSIHKDYLALVAGYLA